MSGFNVCLLGAPRIERDSTPVAFERHRSVALLAYLAVERRAIGRESLAALFWPEMDEGRSRTALRHTLVDLQHGIGKGRLALTGDQVALIEGPDLIVDVARFRDLLATVAEHHHPPGRLCDPCLAGLTEAVALYRDDFLAGFTLAGTEEFDTWQTFQAERLRCELSTALEALVLALGGRGEHGAALAHAQRWLALDPLCEPAHRALMRLYAATGDPAAALRQYEQCARALQAELGIAPDPETTALQAEIRSGTWERAAPAAPPAGDNLPPDLTPFIGREAELAFIADRLAHPACRLLTVLGPGGIGKTRLAVQAARSQTERFDHGVCFIDLAPVPSADLLPEAILRGLHRLAEGGRSAKQQVLAYLADRHMLLLLDNCEHLLDGIAFLTELLLAAPRVKLLATSRARLNLHSEWLAPLEGLQLPDEDEGDLEACDATALFMECMRRLQPGYRPDAADTGQIVRLCRLLDGIPLAIELAAGWARVVPLEEIAGEISRDLAFLATRDRDVPARLRSMQATFEHSWRLLDERRRGLLSQASVFRGGFTLEAVQAVTGARLEDLQELVDASWLWLGPGGRYAMHELIRQYAAAKLESLYAENVGEVRRQHCTYFAQVLDLHAGPIWRGQDPVALVEQELGNLLAAWSWAVGDWDLRLIARLARGFASVVEPTGWYREFLSAIDPAVARLKAELAALRQGELDAGAGYEVAAAALAWVLFCEKQCYGHMGPFERAIALNEECATLVPRNPVGALWGELPLLVPVYRWLMPYVVGRWRECLLQAPELLVKLRQLEARFGPRVGDMEIDDMVTLCHWWTGMALMQEGRYEEALALIEQRIAWAKRTGSWAQINAASDNYIGCLAALGEYEQAEALAREVLSVSQSRGNRVGVAGALEMLGWLANARGSPAMALAFCQRALPLYRQVGEYREEIGCLRELGIAELAQGRPLEAGRYLAEACDILVRTGTTGTVTAIPVLLSLGHVAAAQHDPGRTRDYYRQALSGPAPGAFEVADALRGMAGVLLLEGDTGGAARLLALVIRSPLTAQPVRTLAEKTFQELAARVPPEQLAAAVEWAQGCDTESVLAGALRLEDASSSTGARVGTAAASDRR